MEASVQLNTPAALPPGKACTKGVNEFYPFQVFILKNACSYFILKETPN
jgi:hypothetical protein